MKILVLNYEYPPLGGGGGHRSRAIATGYARDHEVYFLTSGWQSFGISRENGYTLNQLSTGRKRTHICTTPEMLVFVIKAWRELDKIFKEQRFDRVHVFFGVPTGLLLFHPKLKKIPAMLWACGSDVPWHNKERFWLLYLLLTPLIKLIWKKSASVVCNSEDLKAEINHFSPELPVKVIPNGVDTDTFRPSAARPERPFTVLCAGRLIPLKRTEVLIQAAALLKSSGSDVRIKIAGEGAERAALAALTAKLGVTDTVVFLGDVPREQMPQVYREADLFAHMSRIEGMSNAILEAMASGLPVIASAAGGAAQLIKDCGTTLTESTADNLAKAITVYIATPGLAAAHGTAAREKAETMGWEKSATQYLALLTEK